MTSPFQRHEEITIEEHVTFDDDLRRSSAMMPRALG